MGMLDNISRTDLAEFILDQVESKQYVNTAVFVK